MEAISAYLSGFGDLASNISVHAMGINHNALVKENQMEQNSQLCAVGDNTLFNPANKICRDMLKWVSV